MLVYYFFIILFFSFFTFFSGLLGGNLGLRRAIQRYTRVCAGGILRRKTSLEWDFAAQQIVTTRTFCVAVVSQRSPFLRRSKIKTRARHTSVEARHTSPESSLGSKSGTKKKYFVKK